MSVPEDPWLWPESPVPTVRPAAPIAVYRYNATTATDGDLDAGPLELLPGVRCVRVARSRGADPGHATLRYAFDGVDPGSPQTLEDALSDSAGGRFPHAVLAGDRIVVLANMPPVTEDHGTFGDPDLVTVPGPVVPVFDGFALNFAGMADAGRESVTIHCVGVAHRERDAVMGGALLRDASKPTDAGANFQSDLPARFNPKGEGNATASGPADAVGPGGKPYPVFVDVNAPAAARRTWTLAMAVRHLCYVGNPAETYTATPDPADLNALLVAKEPIDGVAFDPANTSTYTATDVDAPDRPITGKDWPSLVEDLIGAKGYAMEWALSGDDAGIPTTTLRLFDPQSAPVKSLHLQARGEDLDPERSNVGGLDIGRDLDECVSRWIVEGAPHRYEVSLVLAPGFPADQTGTDIANLGRFKTTAATFATGSDYDKYRLYVFNEDGTGYYSTGLYSIIVGIPSLDTALGANNYTHRRRRPIGTLLTTDANGKVLKAELAISKDYWTNPSLTPPQLWDGTGTWQVVHGNWELLKDRLGIRITAEDPNAWKVGTSTVAGAPFSAGVVNGVGAQATYQSGKSFALRLTCVIEGDLAVKGDATRRDASPLPYDIIRRIDAKDRYRNEFQAYPSALNFTGGTFVVRADDAAAQAEAEAARDATDAGQLHGSITIPRFTMYYEIGDQIDSVDGRGLGFRTDGGADANAAVYPTVVAVTHDFEPQQVTHIDLSDSDARQRLLGLRRLVHHRRHRQDGHLR